MSQRADRVPFLPGRRLVAVRVTLNELDDAVLIVDTGAERTVISQRLAARLGLDQARPLRLQVLAGIGQSAPAVLDVTDQLFLLAVDGDRRLAPLLEGPRLL